MERVRKYKLFAGHAFFTSKTHAGIVMSCFLCALFGRGIED